jgi:hypothetical protein
VGDAIFPRNYVGSQDEKTCTRWATTLQKNQSVARSVLETFLGGCGFGSQSATCTENVDSTVNGGPSDPQSPKLWMDRNVIDDQ